MPYGHIKRIEPAHGFGFICDDSGLDWFFVKESLRDRDFDKIWVNERVGFSPEWTPRGPRATDIHFEQVD